MVHLLQMKRLVLLTAILLFFTQATPASADVVTVSCYDNPELGGDSACLCNCPDGYTLIENNCQVGFGGCAGENSGCTCQSEDADDPNSIDNVCDTIQTPATPIECQASSGTYYCSSAAVCTSAGGTAIDPPNQPPDEPAPVTFREFEPCNYTSDSGCSSCVNGGGVWTAIGCIPVSDPQGLAVKLIRFGIGIGGGIALLIMLFGVGQIIMAGGNPEKVQAGRETITGALTGLIIIIFAAAILQFVGAAVLKLPGLATPSNPPGPN